ncbi:acetyltransferase [Vibrio sp. MACH09]|uniref:N-acetyltransferase n=1 Tax=unclassified Vibrio TaxID=2614977 RepID=UPI0014936471|nr:MULTISPECIES: N-acetyltransferase [unclassified Vibrio]NOI68589.1 N-acetyltransferase [Vibrio sp. 99-8-1]GLO62921.1 acetyltransferase [Vibrio sp. MACH09]
MIRQYTPTDIEPVLDIWLKASIKAHDFVAAEFWQSQQTNMRDTYLPASKNYLFEIDSKVVGFYSLYDNLLAAIFVLPEYQGQGIGKQLMAHAKEQCSALTLNVYKDNDATYKFYLSQGFKVDNEHICEHTGCAEYAMSINA